MKSDNEGGILGSILRGVGELVDLAQKLDAEGKTELSRTGTLGKSPGKRGPAGHYGFNIKVGLPAKNVPVGGVMGAGDVEGPSLKEREPVIDVFDEGHFIRVVAELPAVSDEEVIVNIKENVLYLKVRGNNNPFSKSIMLPEKVKPETLRKSLRNGILEVLVDVQV
ncbi:MAG: hypothetical protein A4E55_02194 [Pelotomaculum sp. PtaU1.Bin035]|nr:MAG: hypothetical protein A4E55_02194 [Pelotomaculum sp. PtaU1.Bin035]